MIHHHKHELHSVTYIPATLIWNTDLYPPMNEPINVKMDFNSDIVDVCSVVQYIPRINIQYQLKSVKVYRETQPDNFISNTNDKQLPYIENFPA